MNKYYKTAVVLAVIFELLIVYTGLAALLQQNNEVIKLSLLAAFSIIVPFILSFFAKKKNLNLPISFKLFGVLFIFASQYLGEIKDFYEKTWWWDLMLHGALGSYAVLTFIHIIKEIIRKEIEVTRKRYCMTISIIAFCFAVSLGTLWEIFEFSGDFIFNTGMVKGGLEDTMGDLIVKSAAALITSLIFYFRNRK